MEDDAKVEEKAGGDDDDEQQRRKRVPDPEPEELDEYPSGPHDTTVLTRYFTWLGWWLIVW